LIVSLRGQSSSDGLAAATVRAKSADIVRLAAEGVTREGIAEQLGIGIASVYRVLAASRA
jgi:hypothetical protein